MKNDTTPKDPPSISIVSITEYEVTNADLVPYRKDDGTIGWRTENTTVSHHKLATTTTPKPN